MNTKFQSLVKQHNYKFLDNVLAFQKGPLSQWYGGFADQKGGLTDPDHKLTFNCCEQYMMFKKADYFGDPEIAEKILKTKNPKEQKALGRQVQNFKQEEWDEYKELVVYQGNYYKYRNPENKEFRELIDNIPNFAIIVEAAPWDPIWGNGLDILNNDTYDIMKWQGTNLLGKILMELVQTIRVQKSDEEKRKKSLAS